MAQGDPDGRDQARLSGQGARTGACAATISKNWLNMRTGDRTLPRALIIGGSVGGLFAANLLRSIGWVATVFEKSSSDLAHRGRNIGATEDLFAIMRQAGVHADASLGVAWRSRICLDRTGSVVCEVPVGGLTTLWSSIYAPLEAVLPSQLYRRGMRLERVEQDASSVTAIFADGSRETGQLLIGADGVHSTVRHQFLPEIEPHYCGYVVWHVAADGRGIPCELRDVLLEHMTFSFPDREMVLSIPTPGAEGRTDLGGRRCQFAWFRAVDENTLPQLFTDISGRRHDGSAPPSLIQPRFFDDLKTQAKALLPIRIADLFERAPQPTSLHASVEFASPRIVFGRVALLGDAAFVARRHVATGVTKAATDAKCLTDALATSGGDVQAALERYQHERQQAGDLLVARGSRLGGHVETQLKLRTHPRAEEPHRWRETVMREYGAAGVVSEDAL